MLPITAAAQAEHDAVKAAADAATQAPAAEAQAVETPAVETPVAPEPEPEPTIEVPAVEATEPPAPAAADETGAAVVAPEGEVSEDEGKKKRRRLGLRKKDES